MIFDFDGTLADSFPWFASVFNGVAARFGLRQVDPRELPRLRALDGHALLEDVGLPLWKLPRIAAHMRGMMTRDADRIRLFPGMDGAITSLRGSGARLAIVSSNSRDNVCAVLGDALSLCFDHYECGVSIFGKATKLRRVLAKTGVAASDAVFIGDEVRDADAARDAKLAFGAVSWGYNLVDTLATRAPALAFSSVEDMLEKLLGA